MRTLLVEDEEASAEAFLEVVESLGGPSAAVDIAGSLSSALSALEEHDYDYAVCDLWLPPHDRTVQTEREHGLRVVEELRKRLPGTPCAILTGGQTDDRAIFDRLAAGGTGDLFGTGVPYPLLELWKKDELLQCAQRFCALASELELLEAFVCTGEADLPLHAMRVVRLFTRSQGGTSARIRSLGGFSDAIALQVEVLDGSGKPCASAFAKIGPLDDVGDELDRYRRWVAVQLPVGSFPAFAAAVRTGAGRLGGNFYTLLQFEASLFERLGREPGRCRQVIQSLCSQLHGWQGRATEGTINVGDFRRRRVDNGLVEADLPTDVDGEIWTTCEAMNLNVRWGPQHGDLHGENVLVGTDDVVTTVDFSDAGILPSVYDAVVLELSFLFHPRSPTRGSGWPTIDEASNWWDIDRYVARCPLADAVRTCREWALRCDREEAVAAVAYTHAVRQIKYHDTPKELVWAVARSAAGRLVSS